MASEHNLSPTATDNTEERDMATQKTYEKIENMANFIKKQSNELLYKLNQLDDLPDHQLMQQVEKLCGVADTVRTSIRQFTGTHRETLSIKHE